MPLNPILGNLIRYIINEVIDQEGTVYRTRLVKLLYICDLEYYRLARKTLTGLGWVRYKFGPFAYELNDVVRGLGFDIGEESEDFVSGKGVRTTAYLPPDPDKWLEPRARTIVDRVLKRWALEDLGVLLDYVYCDTEPMKDSAFGKPLDFAKVISGLRSPSTDKIELSASDREGIVKLLQSDGIVSLARVGLPGLEKGTRETKPRAGDDEYVDLSGLQGRVSSSADHSSQFVENQE
jgi:hypothetical protein